MNKKASGMYFLIWELWKPCTYVIEYEAGGKVLSQLIKPVKAKSLPFVSREAFVYANPAPQLILVHGRWGELD